MPVHGIVGAARVGLSRLGRAMGTVISDRLYLVGIHSSTLDNLVYQQAILPGSGKYFFQL